MKKIFVTREIPSVGIDILKEKGYEVDMNKVDGIPSQEEIITRASLKNYDVMITLLTDKIDSKVFDALPSVKMYANYAVGFDNIDVKEALRRDVVVTNTPSVHSATAVAEHTIALMFALGKKIVEADKFVRNGKYIGWSPINFLGEEFALKTFGIVGGGRIGEKVAVLAKSIGMKIVYTDVKRNENLEKVCGALYFDSLSKMLPEADVVSLHVPLVDSTKHLINKDTLKLMKPTAILINTSRGPVVEEEALINALNAKIIAGAGLDVFEFEPKISAELFQLSNVVLTPHIASASIDAREEMSQMVAKNVIAFLEGLDVPNALNI